MGPLHVIIEVDEPLVVSPRRDRLADVDPLMTQIQQSLQTMLDRLALESKPISPSESGQVAVPTH